MADFEFQAGNGEQPLPVCLVAREYLTGREIRLWQDDLRRLDQAPFPTDRGALFIAYYASAEIGCFLALGWPLPEAILDLFAEFRAATNGLPLPAGSGLLGALAYHGLDSMAGDEKTVMRDLVLRGGPWTVAERAAILDYCASDTTALAALFPKMLPAIQARGTSPLQGLGQALLRGRYMAAAARMEWAGVPVDAPLLAELRANWGGLAVEIVGELAADFPVFEGVHFRQHMFGAYLEQRGIAWPRLPSGRLDLSNDTFRDLARTHPAAINPIREVRVSLAELRLNELAVGKDGRNRTLLSAFRARSGRNQPSNSRFVFGPARWIRSLIKPPPGRALAYVDFSAQELAIAACLSGDEGLWADYLADPYLGFGRRAGFVPADATKATHRAERERFKAVVLGMNYGMSEYGLALRLSVPIEEARQLLQAHRRAYRTFWAWSDAFCDAAQLGGLASSVFGWPLAIRAGDNPRTLRNFPMQANGAEMLRLACIFATEAGLRICAPVHDALLIEAPAESIDVAVAQLQEHMGRASELVLGGGRRCRSDATIVQSGERYSDERGAAMFERLVKLMARRRERVAPVCSHHTLPHEKTRACLLWRRKFGPQSTHRSYPIS